ncbi:MAG: hypothetical protein PVJ54_09465 [Desulfobacterales bacterium]
MMDYVPTRTRRRARYRYLAPNISLLADYVSAKCLQSRQDAAPTTDVKSKGRCGEKLNSGSGFPATKPCFFPVTTAVALSKTGAEGKATSIKI